MLRLIMGSVTLAAVGYALKEHCAAEGCPWDEKPTSSTVDTKKQKNGKIAKEFHKNKKIAYNKGMKAYQTFIEQHKLKDTNIETDVKLKKQKFPDVYVTEEVQSALDRISNMIKILSYNIELNTNLLKDKSEISKEVQDEMYKYAQSLFTLSNLKIFIGIKLLNKNDILQAMYDATALSVQNNTIHVNLQES